MTSKEAAIYQLKKLKGKPWKQKLEHIFTYFWRPILALVIVLALSASYIVHLATAKDSVLTVACINAYTEQGQVEDYLAGFARYANINQEKYQIEFSANMMISNDHLMDSYETIEVLVAQVVAQAIDVVAMDLQTVNWYMYHDTLVDLTQVLRAEQQARYGQYYLYMDKAFLRELQMIYSEEVDYPDPTKPELMEEPVAVALHLPEKGQFPLICYPHKPGEVVVGIVGNSLNADNALQFLEYIMQ